MSVRDEGEKDDSGCLDDDDKHGDDDGLMMVMVEPQKLRSDFFCRWQCKKTMTNADSG